MHLQVAYACMPYICLCLFKAIHHRFFLLITISPKLVNLGTLGSWYYKKWNAQYHTGKHDEGPMYKPNFCNCVLFCPLAKLKLTHWHRTKNVHGVCNVLFKSSFAWNKVALRRRSIVDYRFQRFLDNTDAN